MPSRRKKNGDFKDVAHPLNNETRRWMETRILTEYEATLGGEVQVGPAATGPGERARAASPVSPAPKPPKADEDNAERSLAEVQRDHLSDSFWSVP
jgi:hypothetical protein